MNNIKKAKFNTLIQSGVLNHFPLSLKQWIKFPSSDIEFYDINNRYGFFIELTPEKYFNQNGDKILDLPSSLGNSFPDYSFELAFISSKNPLGVTEPMSLLAITFPKESKTKNSTKFQNLISNLLKIKENI